MQMLSKPVEYGQALQTALTLDAAAYQDQWYGEVRPAAWPQRHWGHHCRLLLADALSDDPTGLSTNRLRAFLDVVRAAGIAWPAELLPLVGALALGNIPACWLEAHRLRLEVCFGEKEARASWSWLREHDPEWETETPVVTSETPEETE